MRLRIESNVFLNKLDVTIKLKSKQLQIIFMHLLFSKFDLLYKNTEDSL